ncbi:ATPase family gene 2 protein homolog B-like isoform X1 [Daphnia carinata]|uniref:ATPase family gene 2 protein homolog B-like isoform X1 n=2 Tax=Daphnia carinata TaxID=120202 RepID=UPI00257BE78E|nr:ATPase family gene 2 protein homolog B-like isoform X1 [Daphnia carinata]
MNPVVIASESGSQKLCLPIEDFIKLECYVGAPVKVTTSKGTFICKVYPRTGFKNDAIIENTVQIYSERRKFLLIKPLLVAGQLCASKLTTKPAMAVSVTIVTNSYQTVGNLKKCKLPLLVKSLLSNKIISQLSSISVGNSFPAGNVEKVLILETKPGGEALTVSAKTQIKIENIITEKWMQTQEKVQSTRLGGVAETYRKLKELVVHPLEYPDVFSQLCAPRGILLHGPPGCGKSSIVQQLCAENGLFLIPVTCSDLSSSDPGGSEEKLRNIFRESLSVSSPTILFLDGVDSICPKRGGQTHTNRLITCLTGLIDGIDTNRNLTVMAATNRLEDVDPSLRRPGRLDREVHLYAPNCHQREEIINAICQDLELGYSSEDVRQVAEMTPGFVGADLNLLCREAFYVSEDANQLTLRDWKAAIGRVRPSAMRNNSGNGKFRRVSWDEVGGLEEARMYIRRSVEWPLKYPEAFERLNVPRPKGVLIYGPPGCGKSLLVRAAASSCTASFLSISAAELFSPFVGDSEKMVSDLFRRARQAVPAILFLDELDAMVGGRTNANHGRTAQLGVVAALLQEMDGISSSQGVVVVGATNRPDKIDGALLRPGRFDSLVHIPHPDEAARLAILESLSRKMPLKDVDLKHVAERTNLFSGADLESLTKEAALGALEEDMSAFEILQKHFDQALAKVAPSLTAQQVNFYSDYASGKRK